MSGDREALGWYVAALARHRWRLAAVVALAAAPALANLPALWLIRHAFDTAIPDRDIRTLLLIAGAILACRIAAALPAAGLARTTGRAVRAVTADLRSDVMARLHRLRWQDLAEIEGARAHSRIINETDRIEQMTHVLFHSLLPALVPALLYVLALFAISWQLALMLLILAPLMRAIGWWSAMRLKRAITGFQRAFERFHTATHEAIRMLPVARIQASEGDALARHRARVDALAEAGTGMAAASSVNIHLNSLAGSVVAVAVLAAGGIAVIQGVLTFGALAAFFVAAAQANANVSAVLGTAPQLLSGRESLRRIAELHRTGSEDSEWGDAEPDFAGALQLDAVSFAHPGRPVLAGARIAVEPGRVTALAALNGEGKSTLLAIAAGLLPPDDGQVILGEAPLQQLDRNRYLGRIGMLPQHPLFHGGSVRDNICYGRTEIDETALTRAIWLAGLEPVLEMLAQGLDTPMGDGGQLLSGGERQRVALARALVHGPQLLLLDEPGNHLDADAVALILARLFNAPDRPTILMATHDARLLAVADTVYELEDGQARLRPLLRLATRA